MTNGEDRLDRIETAIEQLANNSPNQRLDSILAILDRTAQIQATTAENIERMRAQQAEQHQQTIAELQTLREVAQQQATTIQQFVTTVAQQARTIADMTQSVRDAVRASQRAAQAAETATVLAQSNQEAIRDLIDELRQQRG